MATHPLLRKPPELPGKAAELHGGDGIACAVLQRLRICSAERYTPRGALLPGWHVHLVGPQLLPGTASAQVEAQITFVDM